VHLLNSYYSFNAYCTFLRSKFMLLVVFCEHINIVKELFDVISAILLYIQRVKYNS